MMGTFFALLLAILAVEYFLYLPFVKEGKKSLVVVQKSVRILSSKRISDHWKERALIRYAQAVIKSTLYLALMLSGLLVWMSGSAFLLDKWFNPEPTTIETLASPMSWIWITVIATIYLYARNRFILLSNKSDYSFGDRLLHRLALGSPLIGRISLEIDQALSGNNGGKQEESPVFICALARAGTTILMRTFYDTGKFRSLTYREMPFVLMPGIWKRLSKSFHQYKAEEERAHGDGIGVNFDSPEAFEEVFWRVFSSDEYLYEDHLSPYSANTETIHRFQQFVSQVISSANQPHQQRYLSKNNNNILRLGSIRRAFPDALIIVPFRDPIQHAISLFHQHTQFCATHKADPFSYNYMKWLGHHEFGGTHRPFQFGDRWAVKANDHRPENINYWLALWINTYRYLLETAPQGTFFVSFEELCREPQHTLSMLFSRANVVEGDFSVEEKIRAPKVKQDDNIEQELKKQALQTYHDLSDS
ncbi:MAG: sulfotransferase [Desulfobacteraceae bacterium]|nr:sulfotransferase [Desulfobacteraceae bacterium]